MPAEAENLDLPSEKLPEKTELINAANRKNTPRMIFVIAKDLFGRDTKRVRIETSQLMTSTRNCYERLSW